MKSLLVPMLTAPWIPPESELPKVLNTGVIIRNGAEWTTWEESAIYGAPQSFHDSCSRLLSTFVGRASGVLLLGTTGEWPGMWPLQSLVAFSAMAKTCPIDITLYAGVLGGDGMVADQVRSAQLLGINNIVLWLNHTRNNIARFQAAIWALGASWRLFLYNLPTFRPAKKDFIRSCLEDSRVIGFKDSSEDPEFFSWLLSLKAERPDFQVFHGSEPAYWKLSPEDFDRVDGLVSGNANVHPALLHEYTKILELRPLQRGGQIFMNQFYDFRDDRYEPQHRW